MYMNLIQAEFEGVLGKFYNFLKVLGRPLFKCFMLKLSTKDPGKDRQ